MLHITDIAPTPRTTAKGKFETVELKQETINVHLVIFLYRLQGVSKTHLKEIF